MKAVTTEGLLGHIKELLGEYKDLSLQFVNYHRDIAANHGYVPHAAAS